MALDDGFFFFTKRGLEVVHQVDFTEDGKKVIEKEIGVTKKVMEEEGRWYFRLEGIRV